jgi:hypothetical protein
MDTLRNMDHINWFRSIQAHDTAQYQRYIRQLLLHMDHADPDEDSYDETFARPNDMKYPRTCYPSVTAWNLFPTCNNFHDQASLDSFAFPTKNHLYVGISSSPPLSNYRSHHNRPNGHRHDHDDDDNTFTTIDQHYYIPQAQFIGHGYYRDTWLLPTTVDSNATDDEETTTSSTNTHHSVFVLKTLKALDADHDHPFNFYQMHKVTKESVVMEALTSSPRIVDIYGHCSTSTMAEYLPGDITTQIVPGDKEDYDRGHISQVELDDLQQDDVHPLNNFTVMEKLSLALLMTESLADLHGLPTGVFVHGDAHPDQWLVTMNGALKLNDFNNGNFLEFNPHTMEYCKYWTEYGGAYKSPEEFRGDYCDEGVDVWALGHGIFGLLTGLYPYYRTKSHAKIRQMVMDGKKPYIDPRYRTRGYMESRMVQIMERCWEYESEHRVSVFEVAHFLRETIRLSNNHHYQHHSHHRQYHHVTKKEKPIR